LISITVTQPSDFSVLKNFRRQNSFLKIARRTGFETSLWILLPQKCGL